MRLLTILIFLPFALSAQKGSMKMDVKILDYGTIKKGDERIIEFEAENVSTDTVLILKMDVPSTEYSVRFSTKKIAPNEKTSVRVKYNPKAKGTFSDELTLYFSNMTAQLKAKGKVDYLEWADFTPCPDFERTTGERATDYEVTFKVIDRKTKEVLDNVDITLVGKVQGQFTLVTDRKGLVSSHLPIDHYEIKADRAGYGQFAMDTYINRRNKDFTLELLPGEKSHTIVMRPDMKPKEEPAPAEDNEVRVEVVENEEGVIEVPEPIVEEFSIDAYRPNNVVFLIDVSTSMRKDDRLDILKSSMVALTEMLRPTDKLSIITYASKTEVHMSGQAVEDKEAIIKIINELSGEGLTAGEAGIKKAYNLAGRHRIDEGNNQVYLATDGAFNKGSDQIMKIVKKEAKNGTNMSVLAIRGSKWSADKMEALSKAGKGDFLKIEEFDHASSDLRELVKKQAALK